jgi:hypothetical protein
MQSRNDEAKNAAKAQKDKQNRRFQIVKLEERIAPSNKGGTGKTNGNFCYCVHSGTH